MPTSKAFRNYVAIPFAFASVAATGTATIGVLISMTGYRGKYQTSVIPTPFAEAWTDVATLAGLIFVVTFLVLAIWVKVRWREQPTNDHPSN